MGICLKIISHILIQVKFCVFYVPRIGYDQVVMNHTDHVNLLRGANPGPGGRWGDFGSGKGAFTLALAELLGPEGSIYSIDRSGEALREQELEMKARFQDVKLRAFRGDFNAPLSLPELDGIVMANALHFQRDKKKTLEMIQGYLKPRGKFILVEYNTDQGNPWVPYPLSIDSWLTLAQRCGFADTRLLARVPSSFLGEIYSVVSWIP